MVGVTYVATGVLYNGVNARTMEHMDADCYYIDRKPDLHIPVSHPEVEIVSPPLTRSQNRPPKDDCILKLEITCDSFDRSVEFTEDSYYLQSTNKPSSCYSSFSSRVEPRDESSVLPPPSSTVRNKRPRRKETIDNNSDRNVEDSGKKEPKRKKKENSESKLVANSTVRSKRPRRKETIDNNSDHNVEDSGKKEPKRKKKENSETTPPQSSFDELLRISAPYIKRMNKDWFHCRLCGRDQIKLQFLKSHIVTVKHKKQVSQLLIPNNEFCSTCAVFSASKNMTAHVNGKKHQKAMEKTKNSLTPSVEPMSYEQLVDLLQSVEQITTVPISVPGGREEVTGKPTCQPTSSAVSEPSKMEGSVIEGNKESPGETDLPPKRKNCSNSRKKAAKTANDNKGSGTKSKWGRGGGSGGGRMQVEIYNYKWDHLDHTSLITMGPSLPKPYPVIDPSPSSACHRNEPDRPYFMPPPILSPCPPPHPPPHQGDTTLKQLVQTLDGEGEKSSGNLQNVINSLVQNEEDAEAALKLSSALTQALLTYRQRT